MNSIDSGAIFPPRSGQDLSRNVVVVSVYALYKKLYTGIGFFVKPKNRDFHEKCSLQASCSFWAALPVAPAAGKVLRPQGRIPYDSYSLSSSKSNTGAGEIAITKACQNSWQIATKIEDISKSVNSIDSGAIFLPR